MSPSASPRRGPYFLGYDVGSSFVKAALLDGDTGRCVARASAPEREMEILAPRPGWAEQDPEVWWENLVRATREVLSAAPAARGAIGAIGIAYQMHGLVLVDEAGRVLRPAILWCDGRAAEVGRRAFEEIGKERCLRSLLNSPGNFTASRLRWVTEHEPDLFARARCMLLPGDWVAMRLGGRAATTVCGLSEAILWDFERGARADFLLERFAIPESLVPDLVPTFGPQGELHRAAAEELGLAAGTPVTYRAGDQPNNAFSLGVLEPGDVAATAGTSGVVYAVGDVARPDPVSRFNAFAHVNHGSGSPRLGALLCISGAGIANRWAKLATGSDRTSYEALDRAAATVPPGCEGLQFLPFGNGPERMFEDRELGAHILGLDFNRHRPAHVLRAVQEGIAFAFRYGMDLLSDAGIRPRALRAPRGNLFKSPVFRETLAGASGVAIDLFETDGAEGAARGAAIGARHFASFAEAFRSLERPETVEPADSFRVEPFYRAWLESLEALLAAAKP